ncbi:MAG: endonuclease/exonuclease/phosphatase family protein [Bacteroidaceae bacterium]|nr:endonuclease/exonuclease/phosphatase family protein [Bacteroidaceae bacterium]
MLKRLAISIFLGANLCTILLLWLSVALTYISPEHLPRLSLLTLAFPVFLAANILFLLFWLLFKARLTWVPIAGMLLVGGHILDYTPLNLQNNSNNPAADTTLTIVTYNANYPKSKEESTQALLQHLKTTNADIVCIQEISRQFFNINRKWLDSTDYQVRQDHSIAILSKHPFLSDAIHIDYPTRKNHSVACWINYYGDSLLIINNHLESNHLSNKDKDEYTHTIIDPNQQAIKNSTHILIDKLSKAANYRGAQTDSICTIIDHNHNHSTIVCGDLNDTPISYTYQQLAKRLTSAYREAGTGPGFTYSRRSFPVRIDHLFFSNDWTCNSCRIDHTISSSDHYPLIVRLNKKIR